MIPFASVLLAMMATQKLVEPQSPLIDAINSGNLPEIKKFLENKGNPNVGEVTTQKPNFTDGIAGGKKSPGRTALEMAVDRKSMQIVKLLLEARADPNRKGGYGWTPLMSACQNHQVEMINLLLKCGANPNLTNPFGDTAIVMAANRNLGSGLEALVKAGASLKNGIGDRAILTAVESSSEKAVLFLLDAGVNPNGKDRKGWTLLEIAVFDDYGNDGIIPALKSAGGKGRSRNELVAELKIQNAKYMKELEAKRSKNTRYSQISEKPTQEDLAIFRAVLVMLADDKDFDLSLEKLKIGKVVLVNEIGDRVNEYSETLINGDLDERKALDLDLAMRKDFLRRNGKSNIIDGLDLGDPKILVAKFSEVWGPRKELSTWDFLKKVGAKGWVTVQMPGYSLDRMQAFLRFSYGPTMHGASGTILLRKTGDKWKIVWKSQVFYS